MSHRRGPFNHSYLFTCPVRVPSQGTAWFLANGLSTNDVPVPSPITGAFDLVTVRVDQVDASRSYNVELLAEGVVVETIAFSTSTLKLTQVLTAAITVGDDIQGRIVLDTGSGRSAFRGVNVNFALKEDI